MIGAALLNDGGLDLVQDLLEITGFLGQIQTQSTGIAHQGRGQVGLDEVAAALQQALQQRLGVRIVGAEVSSLLAVLLDPCGHLLQNVGLSAGNADIRGGIGSRLQDELHAELLAGGLHDGHAAAHGLIGHVAGEGDMYEGIAAQLVRGADDQIAAGHEVVVGDQVGSGADLGQILVSLACDADDVRAGLLDLAERLGGAGDSLIDNDGLHQGVGGQVHDALDGGLGLLGEVVGIDGQLDHILAILLLEGLGAAAIILGLRDGAGHDADLVGHGVIIGLALLFAAGDQGERHDESQQQRNYFFHVYLLIPLP